LREPLTLAYALPPSTPLLSPFPLTLRTAALHPAPSSHSHHRPQRHRHLRRNLGPRRRVHADPVVVAVPNAFPISDTFAKRAKRRRDAEEPRGSSIMIN
ncbi:unnamed protein product, partial [Urochloa humidicola]